MSNSYKKFTKHAVWLDNERSWEQVLSVQWFLFIKREMSYPDTCAVPFVCHPTCVGAYDFSHAPPPHWSWTNSSFLRIMLHLLFDNIYGPALSSTTTNTSLWIPINTTPRIFMRPGWINTVFYLQFICWIQIFKLRDFGLFDFSDQPKHYF